ncbi:MAG: ribosome biogenesis GTPase YlqF [Desulfobacteraceae bacterium]|nr:ribosome biogenesis GTPase YlqF [Desulfobacteraceae bacterium]MBC2755218.1 ribosome biogenesis GTPase YlqF [Desulfobacteraceae bacterium]
MDINWQPGHMKKTRDLLKTKLKIVDIVIELIDARAPLSSKNMEIDTIIKQKPRLIILNKSDLSDNNGNIKWLEFLNKEYQKAIAINAFDKMNINAISNAVFQIVNKRSSVRAMIVGIPNVGKSTLINNLAGRRGTKTGNRPGITKHIQWIAIKNKNKLELLDTPGLLNPSSDNPKSSQNLAFIGAIRDENIDIEYIALKLLEILIAKAPNSLEKRYKISIRDKVPREVFTDIAIKRGFIVKNSGIDYMRTAITIMNEYRKGMIGRVTLEYPQYYEDLES